MINKYLNMHRIVTFNRQVCWLSIGRIFHCVALVWNKTNQRQTIQVIRHSPRHSSKGAKVHYRYRFQVRFFV